VAVCSSCRSIIEKAARFCPHCGVEQTEQPERVRIELGSELELGWGKAIVGQVIGEGGMGIVHRGWLYYNPRGRRAGTPPHPVAVKVLHPLLKGRERARKLFLGEARALARLSHPNIVHFFALVEECGQLALVIELVEGQPLSEIITDAARRARPGGIPCLPFVRAWFYFSQLLGALAAIHALGIIHRDVKPSNVLVRTDGVVKLTDFGIARVPAEEARTTGGMAPGTGAYMSPEQVTGGEIDPRSDLYSAAIVLFEMLTGVTPFDAPARNEIMVRTAQVEETAPPMTRLIPQAPPVLDLLMARALAKDPMHRLGSAVEMGEAFRAALGLPESAGWTAQRRLAENAQSISSVGEAAGPGEKAMPEARAAELRTAVMAAYRS
jgi:eukaryotic-like serine/threonine-protein kinase